MDTNAKNIETLAASSTITISIEEYSRLKDIETRFTILKEDLRHSDYCPIHHRIIAGLEPNVAKQKELKADLFPAKSKK